jgi:alkylation response protein AidB-like acyl-CoA dehydrogenase
VNTTATPTQSGRASSRGIPKDAGRETLELVEASRETEWQHPSFVAELFMGRFRPELLFPYPEPKPEDRAQCAELHAQLAAFLRAHVDADAIDEQGEMPLEVIRGLQEAGFFSLKIPREYGGLGVSQSTYGRLMELVGSHCGSTGVWLSAHQSIGVPTPLKLFGTKEQKQRFLPRLVKQDLSGFALTEPNVGSDPGDMQTIAVPAPDGDGWILNGEKLWCTNGTIADVLVVMARTPSVFDGGREKKQITAFLVETSAPGVEIEHRCQFMGLRGLANGQLRFRNVRVPKENVLWGVGKGLKLALITLNTGRLTLPATCSGTIKQALRMAREWAAARKQWGLAIGRHEAIGEKLAAMATDAFAVDAVSWLASGLVDRGGTDIRIEAAMAKLFGSERAVQAVDHAMQIRGGRGYESYASQKARGQELAEPLERLYRDVRINTIVEGSSEIMRLFLAREALDEHMRVAGTLIDPRAKLGAKLKALVRAGIFYARWYPARWLSWRPWKTHAELGGELSGHLRYVERASQRLARAIFHRMLRFGPALERRQIALGRAVDIGTELFAMTACVSKARSLGADPERGPRAKELAHAFCRRAKLRVEALFRALASNADDQARNLAPAVLEGRHAWLEEGILAPERAPATPRG